MSSTFLLIAALVVTFSFSSDADDASTLDPRAERLLAEFNAVKHHGGKSDEWKPDRGPWAPYLRESMIAALSKRERALYEGAMRIGDCHALIALRSTGFLLAHPFLQPAHAMPHISEMFVDTVLKKLPDYKYCFRWQQLTDALATLAKLDMANVLPVRLESEIRPDLGEVEYNDHVRKSVHSLCQAISGLADLAIDANYRTAIEAIVNINEKRDIARLPPAVELYLIERAKALGIDTHDSKERLDLIYYKIKPDERTRIERYAMHHTGKAPSGVRVLCLLPLH